MNLITLCMLPILVSNTYGYECGAPSEACDGMMPRHNSNVAQAGASSYKITSSATKYDLGDTITVTLSGANFNGFLSQAHPSVDTYSTVGKLTDIDVSTNNCAGVYHCSDKVDISYGGTAAQCSSVGDTQAAPLLLMCVCVIVLMVSRFM